MLKLRTFLARRLLWLTDVIAPPAGPKDMAPKTPKGLNNPLAKRILQLMLEQEQFVGRSGESKRHQVLARVMKEFPGEKLRDIGYLIELTLQGMNVRAQ